MDKSIVNELLNRGVITHTGLDIENISEKVLIENGIITKPNIKEIYDDIVEDLKDNAEILSKFISDIANGGVVDVPMNLDLELPIIIEKDVTINLNGYTINAPIFTESNGEIIEGNTDSYVFWVKNGTLTVNGDGKLNAQNANYSIAVWVNGGNAVINGGTYSNSGDNCDLIYISNKGNLEINGGEFIATENKGAAGATNKRSAINIKDKDKSTCNVSVKGGKFYEFNPADNASENPKQNFVAEGYNVTESGNWYVVNKAN